MRRLILSATLLHLSGAILLSSCGSGAEKKAEATDSTTAAKAAVAAISRQDWGEADGKKVSLYTLTNKSGTQIKISTYGGIVTSWVTPDKSGAAGNIVLGFDSLSEYLTKKPPYFGALIGRYGNRIGKGQFSIKDKKYQVTVNDGVNHLHGGAKGFDKVVWTADEISADLPVLRLHYSSKDGEEGYPGNLAVTVTYNLTDSNELKIQYSAETDQPTPVNLTSHSYFNLTGDASKNILDHKLLILADKYTPVDKTLIPTGAMTAVKGTPFDFTTPHAIGERIAAVPGGYDHNWILNGGDSVLRHVATLSDAVSGRSLEVYTDQPGLQFYSGNFLDGTIKTSDGKAINQHAVLCLETQHFPDAPNKSAFGNTILQPGQQYRTSTTYKVVVNK